MRKVDLHCPFLDSFVVFFPSQPHLPWRGACLAKRHSTRPAGVAWWTTREMRRQPVEKQSAAAENVVSRGIILVQKLSELVALCDAVALVVDCVYFHRQLLGFHRVRVIRNQISVKSLHDL